jgi:quinol monooxygenase YgiN
MITASLKIDPMPDKRQSLIEVLMSVQTITRLKQGCIHCDIYEEYGDGHILYVEEWRAKEEMYKHIRSNLYLRILNAIELASKPPEVFFYEDRETKGIELIEAIRLGSKPV